MDLDPDALRQMTNADVFKLLDVIIQELGRRFGLVAVPVQTFVENGLEAEASSSSGYIPSSSPEQEPQPQQPPEPPQQPQPQQHPAPPQQPQQHPEPKRRPSRSRTPRREPEVWTCCKLLVDVLHIQNLRISQNYFKDFWFLKIEARAGSCRIQSLRSSLQWRFFNVWVLCTDTGTLTRRCSQVPSSRKKRTTNQKKHKTKNSSRICRVWEVQVQERKKRTATWRVQFSLPALIVHCLTLPFNDTRNQIKELNDTINYILQTFLVHLPVLYSQIGCTTVQLLTVKFNRYNPRWLLAVGHWFKMDNGWQVGSLDEPYNAPPKNILIWQCMFFFVWVRGHGTLKFKVVSLSFELTYPSLNNAVAVELPLIWSLVQGRWTCPAECFGTWQPESKHQGDHIIERGRWCGW